ncbi:class I SAM-dependent methyltransferase [Candidatus Uhrbacteria bacterium]|nr:class I SAM-dependent methyltransferase [Candidatus Uhrbacteria bacterium]
MPSPQNILFSGEQMIPGKSPEKTEEEHLARYQFAKDFVKGKTVLDVACGVGYGTKMMGEVGAFFVYGVDLSQDVINYAKQHYSGQRLEYRCGNATNLNFEEKFFDVIVSFETIEHLNDHERDLYLKELYRLLKPSGTLIISTPNKRITSPGSITPKNTHHFREYRLNELIDLLHQHGFQATAIRGQRVRRKILSNVLVRKSISFLERLRGHRFAIYDRTQSAEVIPFGAGYEPRYYVVVAHLAV